MNVSLRENKLWKKPITNWLENLKYSSVLLNITLCSMWSDIYIYISEKIESLLSVLELKGLVMTEVPTY